MIQDFIETLRRAGLELTGRELEEVLWLAPYLESGAALEQAQPRPSEPPSTEEPASTEEETREAEGGGDEEGEGSSEQEDAAGAEEPRSRTAEPERGREADAVVPANEGTRTGGTLVEFKSPAAPALPHALALSRALRPLKRRIPSGRRSELDDIATVEQIARGGQWMPIERPVRERWLEVALVVDSSRSMSLWRDTLAELRTLLRHHGAFRDVRTWTLVTEAEDGRPRLYQGEELRSGVPARSWRELVDPSGRRLILVVSDCVSPGWHSGAVGQWLREWGRRGPVSILQMLPQRTWSRTALRRSPAVWLQASEPGAPGSRLGFATAPHARNERWRRGRPSDGRVDVGVPVLTLERDAVSAWARMVAGASDVWSPGVLLREGAERRGARERETRGAPASPGAVERVERFDSTASMPARKLARLLAAAPLSLRIMQLVREALLPEAEQVHFAEVFLGGLIEESGPARAAVDPDEVRYDFVPGVRQVLLESAALPDSVDVLTHVSAYIERRLGQPLDFPALLRDPASADVGKLGAAHQPFAHVAAGVLRQLGGPFAELAERLEASARAPLVEVPTEDWTPAATKTPSVRSPVPFSGRRSSWWVELHVDRVGEELRVTVQGSQGERPMPFALGVGLTELMRFAEQVHQAAQRFAPLGSSLVHAQNLYRALFREELRALLLRLQEASGGQRVLVRLMLRERSLQAFPWEALCEPDTTFGFLGLSPDLAVVRGVLSNEPWQPREVVGALRVLAVSPMEGNALTALRTALEERIGEGEIEWLEPLTGHRASTPYFFERLIIGPFFPHVLHLITHGRRDERERIQLQLADVDGEAVWLDVELLAQQLRRDSLRYMRLIVLEMAEGGRPGVLADAAELLVRAGVDAVVAFLWPVKADIARAFFRTFYRTLAAKEQRQGDVASSLGEARRHVMDAFSASAEAFSPVLYLRGRDSILFDFTRRRVVPPLIAAPSMGSLPTPLSQLLVHPFSLFLGDQWGAERSILELFRARMSQALEEAGSSVPEGLPLNALAQLYVSRRGREGLDLLYQDVFSRAPIDLAFLGTLARRMSPGVHVSLLRRPLLEMALAQEQPHLSLYVIHLSEQSVRVLVLRRRAGEVRWNKLATLPDSLDLERECLVLRPYGGYMPPNLFMRTLLTEDDFLMDQARLDATLTPELADQTLSLLQLRPALMLGMSMRAWEHRRLLQQFFGKRPLPRGSVAIVEPGTSERELWASGMSLPGRMGVEVVEAEHADLLEPLEALSSGTKT